MKKCLPEGYALRHALGRQNFELFCYCDGDGVDKKSGRFSVLGVDANQQLKG
jgi:hypothetical protein